MVPAAALPPSTPFTDHFTPVVNEPVPSTVAVNCCVCLGFNAAELGVTATLVIALVGGGGGGVMELPPPPPQETLDVEIDIAIRNAASK
jgi:hypothetical protein